MDEQLVWVVDRSWRVPSRYHRCRARAGFKRPACGRQPVADLNRGRSAGAHRAASWWAYCGEHLYGRRVRDGHVEAPVHPDSPAAQQGWVD